MGLRRVTAILAAACSCLASCATTTYTAQRTAFVPAPSLPARMGRPLRAGEVQIQAEANSIRLTDVPTLGPADVRVDTPGLLIPRFMFGLGLHSAFIDYVESGLVLRFGFPQAAEYNLASAQLFPDNDSVSFQLAATVRGNAPLLDAPVRLTLSPIIEMGLLLVPQITKVVETTTPWGGGKPTTRTYEDLDHEVSLHASFFLQFDVGVLDGLLHLHVLGGCQRNVRNYAGSSGTLGFLESVPDTYRDMWIATVGAGAEVDYDVFFFGVAFLYPFEIDADDWFGPSLVLRTGVNLKAFTPRAPE
jgi:hypothetical protein